MHRRFRYYWRADPRPEFCHRLPLPSSVARVNRSRLHATGHRSPRSPDCLASTRRRSPHGCQSATWKCSTSAPRATVDANYTARAQRSLMAHDTRDGGPLSLRCETDPLLTCGFQCSMQHSPTIRRCAWVAQGARDGWIWKTSTGSSSSPASAPSRRADAGEDELPVLVFQIHPSLAPCATHAHLLIVGECCIEHWNPHVSRGSVSHRSDRGPPSRVSCAMRLLCARAV